MKVKLAATIACLSISCSAQAAIVVKNSELPTAMQGNFGLMAVSSFQGPNMAAFGYMENSVAKWLIRYGALAPSHSSGSSYDSYTNTFSGYNNALTGHLWLSANQSYDLTSSNHLFNVYFDKLSPSISLMNGYTSAHFNLTSTDLLAGGGYSQITNYGNDTQGNLISGPGADGVFGINYWSCIECDTTVQFNLAMLKYSSAGTSAQLSFNPADPQPLVFKINDYHPDFGSGSSSAEVALYVQSVPLPGSFWLFASGILGLRTIMRRKNT